MERFLFNIFGTNKTITNPINNSEIFNCTDLYKDFRNCRGLAKKGKHDLSLCTELRRLGMLCYFNTEEDFERLLLKKFDDKKKYLEYLKKEDSLLYHIYLNDPSSFSVSFTSAETELAKELNKGIVE